jgi:truncated hemoglobin YjbI
MAESARRSFDDTLNRLVSELSIDERLKFLDKLRGQTTISFEPLYTVREEADSAGQFDAQFGNLPWYYRLAYFILSLFKSKAPSAIYADSQVGKLGKKIETIAPGLYNAQRNILLADFYRLIAELKEAARFFFTALDSSVNRDRGSFYAFLGSLEMEEIHRRLQNETGPEAILEKFPETPDTMLRQTALKLMEDALPEISDTQRNLMYANARSLHCLKELSSFLFDRLLMSFSTTDQSCMANVVRDMLSDLSNILFSLKEPPGISLLESLFIFQLQERARETGFDMNREMRRLLARAEEAILKIRDFNRQVPLTMIIRCAARDTSIKPQAISGGEDWFAVYREYWKRYIESRVADFLRRRKHEEVLSSFRYFLKGMNLKVLENVVSDSNPRGLPVTEAFTLSFLLTFYSAVFMADINTYLRPILLDGEFFKKENRAEFTGAYNDLMKIEDDVKKFDAAISPSGDYGQRYLQAKDDMSSLPVKRRKIHVVLEEASNNAKNIIERSHDAMFTMIKVLGGILKKEAGSKYDTLSNLEKLGGKNQEAFANGIAESIKQFHQALRILKDIEAIGNLW